MTTAERLAELADEFRPVLAAHFPGPVPEALVRELAGTLSGVIARETERTCRPGPWPPQRKRVDEGQASAREARRTA